MLARLPPSGTPARRRPAPPYLNVVPVPTTRLDYQAIVHDLQNQTVAATVSQNIHLQEDYRPSSESCLHSLARTTRRDRWLEVQHGPHLAPALVAGSIRACGFRQSAPQHRPPPPPSPRPPADALDDTRPKLACISTSESTWRRLLCVNSMQYHAPVFVYSYVRGSD